MLKRKKTAHCSLNNSSHSTRTKIINAMQAMILAAGFGTRLLPYTNHRPKPLFPILNTPLLLLTVKRLKRAGFTKIIVNCHHLKEQFGQYLENEEGVILQQEEIILGTGGGLRKALDKLDDSPLLVTNGDIYHTIPFKELYDRHMSHPHGVTMAMHDYPRFNSVTVNKEHVTGFGVERPGDVKLAFTGLHVIDPNELSPIKKDSYSCIIDRYKDILLEDKIAIHRTDNYFWTDMGTPVDYLSLHEGLLNSTIPKWNEIDVKVVENSVLADEANRNHLRCNDWCVIGENVELNHETHISRSVVWDNAYLPDRPILDEIIV